MYKGKISSLLTGVYHFKQAELKVLASDGEEKALPRSAR